MDICIVGIGKLGAAIAGNLVLLAEPGSKIVMCEPHQPNKRMAKAEFWDLIPVAKDRGLNLIWRDKPVKADTYIVTSGIPRKSSGTDKNELIGLNLGIVANVVKLLPNDKPIYIATNPPTEISKGVAKLGYLAKPLRKCTDDLRRKAGNATYLNRAVIDVKGYTSSTPGYAIARQVIKETMLNAN